MIEILPAPDQVVAFKLSGRITGDDMDQLTSAVDDRLKQFRNLGVLADLSGFEDMTAEAIAKDFAYDLGHIFEWGRFPRMAMITDKVWLRGLVRGTSAIMPFIEARVYDPGEQAEALAWVSEVAPQPA